RGSGRGSSRCPRPRGPARRCSGACCRRCRAPRGRVPRRRGRRSGTPGPRCPWCPSGHRCTPRCPTRGRAARPLPRHPPTVLVGRGGPTLLHQSQRPTSLIWSAYSRCPILGGCDAACGIARGGDITEEKESPQPFSVFSPALGHVTGGGVAGVVAFQEVGAAVHPRNGGSFSMPGSGEPAHGKARTAGGLAGAPAAVPMRVRRLGAAVCETFRRESGVVRGRGLAMLLSLTPCPVTDHSVRGLSLDPPAVWLLRAGR